MNTSHRPTRLKLGACAAILGLSLLAGCSSSFGGGPAPAQPGAVVVTPPASATCANGTAPPCY